jgi:L-malate glycosyltransferase
MKVLMVSSLHHPCNGGVNSYVNTLIQSLKERGIHVDLVSLNGQSDFSSEQWRTLNELLLLYKQKFSRYKLDYFIGNELLKHKIILLLKAINIETYDIIHSNNGLVSQAIKTVFPNKPLVGTIHGNFRQEYITGKKMTKEIIIEANTLKRYDDSAITLPDKVITVSSFIDPLIKIPPEKWEVVHNGIDVEDYQITQVRKNNITKIGVTGVIEYRKGFDILLKACKLLIDEGFPVEIELYGDGSEKRKLENYALENEIPATFFGYVHKSMIKKALGTFDIYIQPSRYEPFGLSLTEAMATECAVVGTEIGGIKEQIEHGVNGFLFQLEDEIELKNIMKKLILEPNMRLKIQKAARKTIELKFSKEAMAEKTEKVYHQAIQLRRGG